MDKQIHVIIGPTASGKSALALKRAQELDGVIINCDSMQSYDALPVLTAQPSAKDKAAIPHRLYAHLHPNTHYSAADWRADAVREIESTWQKTKTPIICGGTGFYLKALMEGLSPIPDIPERVREETIALCENIGVADLFHRLKDKDAETEAQIDGNNPARVMRAWEVLQHTGKPLAQWQKDPLKGAPKGWVFHVTALFPDRDALMHRITTRLNMMMDIGIMAEVESLQSLIQSGAVAKDALITKALGFDAFSRHLNGEWSRDQAIAQTQIETRQYAKRQMTWIRNQIQIDDVVEIC